MGVRRKAGAPAAGSAPCAIRRTAVAVMLAGAVPAWPAQAQTDACAAPCVRLVRVAELSTAVAPIVPSLRQSVLRTPDGRILVSHRLIDDPQIVVYDSVGRFLQLYDAAGGGPGEFGSPPELIAAFEGEVWALDQNRLMRFDADLRHIDTRAMDRRYFVGSLFGVSDSTLVIQAVSSPTDTVSIAIVRRGEDWSGRRAVERTADRWGPLLASPGATGGFWTLATNQLRLRRYDERGVHSGDVDFASPYFESSRGPGSDAGVEGWTLEPRPSHMGLFDAGGERLVVITRTTDARWEPTPTNRRVDLVNRDENLMYDAVLGLIDTAAGTTIASLRSDEDLRVVRGTPGYVYSTHADADGHVITKVYRIEVR